MEIGYIRVSTREQNTARQEEMLKGVDRVYIDKLNGKNTNRPALQEMLDFLREGDVVVVESYSRLAISTKDLLNIVEQLEKKKVDFRSLKENVDTSTPSGKLMFSILAGIAAFERETLLQRQREGLDIAMAEGRMNGRPRVEYDKELFEKLYKRWKAGDITAVQFHREMELNPNTFYRIVKRYEGRN